ncbi:hypothetical protein EV126DRAFT_464667 [Verticillium dahliae]|nr:hypothetical protein EV126DRAFT_464676 [Verticillium dahliae]KAH6664555.1 hypothetical protein EV126DRAFT_464667 [Verticillium dahliae]
MIANGLPGNTHVGLHEPIYLGPCNRKHEEERHNARPFCDHYQKGRCHAYQHCKFLHVDFGQDPDDEAVPCSYGQTLTHRLPCRRLDAQGRLTTDPNCGRHMWLPRGILEGDTWISLCYPDGTPNPRGIEIVHRYRPNYIAGPQPLAFSPQYWDNRTAGNHCLPPPPFASGPPFYNLPPPVGPPPEWFGPPAMPFFPHHDSNQQVVNARGVPCQTRSRRRERQAAAPAQWYGETATPLKPRPRVRLPGQYFADDEDKTASGDIEDVSDVLECENRSASCELENHSDWSTTAEHTSVPPDPGSVAEDDVSQGEAPDNQSSFCRFFFQPRFSTSSHETLSPSPIQRSPPPLYSDGTSATQTPDSTASCLYTIICRLHFRHGRRPSTKYDARKFRPGNPTPVGAFLPSAPAFSWVAQTRDNEHTAGLAKAPITSRILNDVDFPALPAVGSVKPQKKDKPATASRGSSESKGKKRSHAN